MIKKEEIIKRKEHKGKNYYYSTYGAAKEIIYLCDIILKLIEEKEKGNE